MTAPNGLFASNDLELTGVNLFGSVDSITVLGDFMMSTASDNAGTTFDATVGGSFFAGGNFVYTGNDLADNLFLKDTFEVGGFLDVDMGNGNNLIDLIGVGTPAVIGGATTIDQCAKLAG